MTWYVLALRLAGLGWYVALSIVFGVVGGLGLDKLAGTIPLFTLLGTLLVPLSRSGDSIRWSNPS